MKNILRILCDIMGIEYNKKHPAYMSWHRILSQFADVPYIPYPVSLATVDMAIFTIWPHVGTSHLLMGKKAGQEKWQLLGGFRDPGETNEEAASRETKEEASVEINPSNFQYIGSFFIDDNRYKDSAHKITTTLMACDASVMELLPQAADDIVEVSWIPTSSINYPQGMAKTVRDVHQKLVQHVLDHIKYLEEQHQY